MKIEELINAWFSRNEGLASRLATFAGSPAVFLDEAPSDSQAGWGAENHYPHIVTTVSLQIDSERKSQGLLRVSLICDILETAPEDIEPLIRSALKDIVMQPDDNPPYCFAWQATNTFSLGASEGNQREGVKRLAACEVVFDVLEYPIQPTISPDPAWGIREAIKREFQSIFVMGVDEIDDYQVATEEQPIIYVRMTGEELDHALYSTVWNIAHLSIHVIAPTADSRVLWAREIYSLVCGTGKVILDDDSPMVIRSIQVNARVDYLRVGQITVDGLFSCVSPRVQEWKRPAITKANARPDWGQGGA